LIRPESDILNCVEVISPIGINLSVMPVLYQIWRPDASKMYNLVAEKASPEHKQDDGEPEQCPLIFTPFIFHGLTYVNVGQGILQYKNALNMAR
jgi:hypothetical protein